MPVSKLESDSLSLHTLYTPSNSSAEDAPPRYSDTLPRAGRSSPSRSSFFSSPPNSISDWTPDTASNFSEQQPFLHDTSSPPPQYGSPRESLDTVIADHEVRAIFLDDPLLEDQPERVLDDPRKGTRERGCGRRRGCRGKDRSCRKGEKRDRWIVSVAVITVTLLMCYFLGWLTAFSISGRRHTAHRNWGTNVPSWAKVDCSSRDGRYNHYEFNDIHDLEISDGPHGAFAGNIRILPPLEGQTADLVMKQLAKKTKALDIKINGLSGSKAVKDAEAQSTSLLKSFIEKRGRCDADVMLYFRNGLSIDNLSISTHAGHLQVFSPLIVNGETSVHTHAGRIDASSFFNTRKTYINSGASSLQGHFKLYDLLSITSTSGSIDVTIEPQEADKAHPKPAELDISTRSGMLKLATSATVPERDYITSIDSRDAMIQGDIIHGSKTAIKSNSGMIQLDVRPYSSAASNLRVDSTSGQHQVTVHSPINGGKLDRMVSEHISQSGAMQLRYPSAWAGKIEGSTSSGSIDVSGRGVHVIESSQRRLRAEKDSDEGKSQLSFRGQSGSVRLEFGL